MCSWGSALGVPVSKSRTEVGLRKEVGRLMDGRLVQLRNDDDPRHQGSGRVTEHERIRERASAFSSSSCGC